MTVHIIKNFAIFLQITSNIYDKKYRAKAFQEIFQRINITKQKQIKGQYTVLNNPNNPIILNNAFNQQAYQFTSHMEIYCKEKHNIFLFI